MNYFIDSRKNYVLSWFYIERPTCNYMSYMFNMTSQQVSEYSAQTNFSISEYMCSGPLFCVVVSGTLIQQFELKSNWRAIHITQTIIMNKQNKPVLKLKIMSVSFVKSINKKI